MRNEKLVPSVWVVIAAVLLTVQLSLSALLLTYPSEDVPVSIAGGVLGMSVLAAVVLGYDMWTVSADSGEDDWEPFLPAWLVPVFLPALSLGVCLGYWAKRAVEASEGDALRQRWWWLVLGAGVISSIGLTALVYVGGGGQPLEPEIAATQAVSLSTFGLTTLAAYYDVQYVDDRLDAAGRDWTLGGVHWVAFISLPVTPRLLVVIVYVLRRRQFLRSVASGPDVPTAEDHSEDRPDEASEDQQEDDGEDANGANDERSE